ncbi:MAG: SH3 domain-containing protein [Phycisphaerae bacterium]|nr:SH3 domain-containing protein [Saprospiraceae bacterium]
MRSGPGTEYEILARLTEGDTVTIREATGENWVKVEVSVWDGQETNVLAGYVYRKYLSY